MNTISKSRTDRSTIMALAINKPMPARWFSNQMKHASTSAVCNHLRRNVEEGLLKRRRMYDSIAERPVWHYWNEDAGILPTEKGDDRNIVDQILDAVNDTPATARQIGSKLGGVSRSTLHATLTTLANDGRVSRVKKRAPYNTRDVWHYFSSNKPTFEVTEKAASTPGLGVDGSLSGVLTDRADTMRKKADAIRREAEKMIEDADTLCAKAATLEAAAGVLTPIS